MSIIFGMISTLLICKKKIKKGCRHCINVNQMNMRGILKLIHWISQGLDAFVFTLREGAARKESIADFTIERQTIMIV